MAKPTASKPISLRDLKVRKGGASNVKGGAPGKKYIPGPAEGQRSDPDP